jgi:endo-alpha-1,4-polygalactosaminidase (GH114 family)
MIKRTKPSCRLPNDVADLLEGYAYFMQHEKQHDVAALMKKAVREIKKLRRQLAQTIPISRFSPRG